MAPSEILPMLEEQLTRIASDHQTAGFSALVGLAIALFSSMKGAKGLITALNIAYDERDERGFIKKNLLALALTLSGVIVLLALVAVLPAVLGSVGVAEQSQSLVNGIRWPLIAAFFILGLMTIYRFGPDRGKARWKWSSWGAMLATVLWLIGSAAFSLYVSNFANFDRTYGSLGAVVIFLLWLQLSAFAVLLGAELDGEVERQLAEKSRTGAASA